MGEALQAAVIEYVLKLQVEVGGIELFVHLFGKYFGYVGFHGFLLLHFNNKEGPDPYHVYTLNMKSQTCVSWISADAAVKMQGQKKAETG
jgi:hypothetical protein